jgi:hypothetical protein
MRVPGWGFRVLRVLRAAAVTAVVIVLVALAFVQVQQRVLRHRAERLLADFQAIRLKQSNWADAEVLMKRWGAWGHYQGICEAEECTYFITLEDKGSIINSKLHDYMEARLPQSYSGITFSRIYRVLGGRYARMRMGFLVENGLVQRDSVGMAIGVPQDDFWCEFNCAGGDGLLLSARASQSLKSLWPSGPWIAGDDEQLTEHPNYKEGRPSGCEGCMAARVTFTPYATQAEITTLTSYNLSCLTRHFPPCRTLPDVLSIARGWRLYPTVEGVPEFPRPSGPPKPCDIPVSVLGRDATSVLEIEVVSIGSQKEPPDSLYPSGRTTETDKVQILSKLKGAKDLPLNKTLDAAPYAFDVNYPEKAAEHLLTGKRLLVLLDSEDRPETLLDIPRCGVFPDTSEVRAELAKGFAQNDVLRQKQEFSGGIW